MGAFLLPLQAHGGASTGPRWERCLHPTLCRRMGVLQLDLGGSAGLTSAGAGGCFNSTWVGALLFLGNRRTIFLAFSMRLCALKRSSRVTLVDYDVEEAFDVFEEKEDFSL